MGTKKRQFVMLITDVTIQILVYNLLVQNCIIMIKCWKLHLNSNRVILQDDTLLSHGWKGSWNVELQLLFAKKDTFSKSIKYLRSHQHNLFPTSCHWCCDLLWHDSSFIGNLSGKILTYELCYVAFMLILTSSKSFHLSHITLFI